MQFVDEAKFKVQAGRGGDGCVSFARAKYKPRGAPDGGDGGDGGDVYLKASRHVNTLIDFRYQKYFQAQNGRPGQGSNRTGASGSALTLQVPLGTVIINADDNLTIGELLNEGDQICIAKGGRHGVGNARFKSSTNRSPRQYTTGEPGQSCHIELQLKLLADVGLLGKPNAGKSTFLSAVSNAHPKVADYPFTTLYPHLGVVEPKGISDSFIIADIPGLIEGAAKGSGLGTQFLKHLERTRLLLHLVDIAPLDGQDPAQAFTIIQDELAEYSQALTEKPQWLVINKVDLLDNEHYEQLINDTLNKLNWQGPVFRVSAVTGQGLDSLCREISQFLKQPA